MEIVILLPFLLPILIWASTPLFKLYSSKNNVYWDGYKKGFEDGIKTTCRFFVSKCPNCGQITLIHDGGCEHCPSCGYSRCG